jgi:hypothetical protein
VQSNSLEVACPRCGAERLLVPGAEYSFDDVALFTTLDTVVHEAELTGAAAALVAAELESVAVQWEPPELVLDRVARHLPRLRECYSPRQDYDQLLGTVSMLLTIVCARLGAPGLTRAQRRSESGIRPRVEDPSAPRGAQGARKVGG